MLKSNLRQLAVTTKWYNLESKATAYPESTKPGSVERDSVDEEDGTTLPCQALGL